MKTERVKSRQVCEMLGIPRGSLYTVRLAAQAEPERKIVNGRATDFYSAEQVEQMRRFCHRRKKQAEEATP